jgi:hypothetical protein
MWWLAALTVLARPFGPGQIERRPGNTAGSISIVIIEALNFSNDACCYHKTKRMIR